MKWLIMCLLIIVLVPACLLAAKKKKESTMQGVEIGLQAPDFSLLDETGTQRTLSEFKGNIVVLYFYPKDDTPGCTKQACAFRDSNDMFVKNNIIVLGINYDSPASHTKFKEKYRLPFILLSDTDASVAKRYGAYVSMLNYFYPQRFTFLIDQQGKVIQIFKDFDPAGNATDILDYLKKNNYIHK